MKMRGPGSEAGGHNARDVCGLPMATYTPASSGSSPDTNLYRTIHAFVPNTPTEISVEVDDLLEAHPAYNRPGYIHVYNRRTHQNGYVPSAFVRPVPTGSAAPSETRRIADAADTAVSDYVPCSSQGEHSEVALPSTPDKVNRIRSTNHYLPKSNLDQGLQSTQPIHEHHFSDTYFLTPILCRHYFVSLQAGLFKE